MANKKPTKVSEQVAMKDPLKLFTLSDKTRIAEPEEVEAQDRILRFVQCPCCAGWFRVWLDAHDYEYFRHPSDGCYFRV